MDHGRAQMLSYTLEAPPEARGPLWIASWLRVRRGGGATSSPGTLRGNPTPLESLAVGDEDREWVTARAAEQTVSGTIWVHEGACWVRNQVARFR